jgi:hypothetical protein
MSSPELETLDQLLGGDLPLTTIRELYPNDAAFLQGVLGLLKSGMCAYSLRANLTFRNGIAEPCLSRAPFWGS